MKREMRVRLARARVRANRLSRVRQVGVGSEEGEQNINDISPVSSQVSSPISSLTREGDSSQAVTSLSQSASQSHPALSYAAADAGLGSGVGTGAGAGAAKVGELAAADAGGNGPAPLLTPMSEQQLGRLLERMDNVERQLRLLYRVIWRTSAAVIGLLMAQTSWEWLVRLVFK